MWWQGPQAMPAQQPTEAATTWRMHAAIQLCSIILVPAQQAAAGRSTTKPPCTNIKLKRTIAANSQTWSQSRKHAAVTPTLQSHARATLTAYLSFYSAIKANTRATTPDSSCSRKPGAAAEAALVPWGLGAALTREGSGHVVRAVQRWVGSVTVFSSPVVQSLQIQKQHRENAQVRSA